MSKSETHLNPRFVHGKSYKITCSIPTWRADKKTKKYVDGMAYMFDGKAHRCIAVDSTGYNAVFEGGNGLYQNFMGGGRYFVEVDLSGSASEAGKEISTGSSRLNISDELGDSKYSLNIDTDDYIKLSASF